MKKTITRSIFLLLLLSFHFYGLSNDSLVIDSKIERIKEFIRSNNDSALVLLESFHKEVVNSENIYGQTQYHFLNGFLLNKEGKFLLAIDEYNAFIKLENDSTSKNSIDQLNRIAICYKALSDFEKSESYYKIAAKLGVRSHYNKGVGDSYSGMGQISERKGKYDQAMEYYLKSNRAFKEAQDSAGISVSYNDIGNTMYYQGDFDQALNYYKKSAHIDFLINNELHTATTYANIGMIYQQLESLDSSLMYTLKSMRYFEKINNPLYLGTIYNNVALVYYDLEEYTTSLEYHLKSKSYKEDIGDKSGLATSFINIGNLMVQLQDYPNAIENYKKGLAICDSIDTPALLKEGYKGLSKAYQKTGNYEDALNFYIIYSEINDSLNAIESKNNVSRLEAEFDSKLKEETIAQQELDYKNDMAIEKAKGETRTIILAGVSLLLIIVTIFFIVFYQKLRLTRKQKTIIEKVNNENKLLLGEIQHRAKNNLQVISSLLSLQERSITDSSVKTAISEGRERVKFIGLIHKMLYQNHNFSGIEMNEYIVKLLDGLMESFGINPSLIEIDSKFDTV